MTTGGGTLGRAVLELEADSSKLDKGLQDAQKRTLKRMRELGKRLTLTLTAPIVAIGASVFHAVETFDEAMARLRVGTGAAGDELKNLERDFKAVFGTVPAGANEIADAMAELNTRLGLTGNSLQDATRSAVELGEIMRIDATQAIQKTAQAMAIFQLPAGEFTSVLDKMFVTSQKTGIGIDALTANLQAYGPVLRNASFTMDESIALFGQLEAAGSDASRVFPGLNAFFRKAADNGQDLRKSLESVISRIQEAADSASALPIATEAFGVEGAQRLITAIRGGAFEIDELVNSLNDADGAIVKMAKETRTNTQRIKIFQRQILELQVNMVDFLGPAGLWIAAFGGLFAGIGPILIALPYLIRGVNALTVATFKNTGATLKNAAATAISKAATVAKTVATAAVTVATAAWTAAQWLLNVALTANPIGLIIVAIGALIAAIVLMVKHWDTVTATIKKNWDIILAILFPGVGIAVLIARRWGAIKNVITGILNSVKSTVIDFVTTIKEVLFGLFGPRFFGILVGGLLDALIKAKDKITGIFRRAQAKMGIDIVFDVIGDIKTKLEEWWDEQSKVVQAILIAIGLANPLIAPFVIGYLIKNTDWSKVWEVVEGFVKDNWEIIKPLLIALAFPLIAPFVIGYLITNTDWSKVWEVVEGFVKDNWEIIKPLLIALAFPLIAPFVIGYLITNTDWSKVWEVVEGFVKDNWEIIKPLLIALAFPLIAPFVIGYLITNTDWNKVWEVVEGFVKDNWEIIKPLLIALAFPLIAPFVIGYLITNTDWNKVWEDAKRLAGVMRDVIQAAIDGVAWVVEVVIKLVPKIISEAVDAVVTGAGEAADIGRDIGGRAADIGRGLFDFFVPSHDTGGIVSSPQLAALAMNSRPEAIIPLDRLHEFIGNGGGGLTVNVHVSGDVNGVEKLREIIRDAVLDGDRRGLEHAF